MTRPIPGDVAWLRREVDLKQEQRARQFEATHDRVPAKVVEIGGTIFVPNKPSFIWVYKYGLPEGLTVALLGSTTVAAGSWVWIGFDPEPNNRWRVLRAYDSDLLPSEYVYISNHEVGFHGANHEYRRESPAPTDPVLVHLPAIQPFKTTGNGDLTITVQALVYYQGSNRRTFSGVTNFSLSTYVPGAGLWRYVLVYLNRAINQLSALAGTAVSTSLTPPQPTLPVNSIPSCLVTLTNGQTAINTATHVLDARPLFNIHDGSNQVLSPGTSTDMAIVRWDGASGSLLQNSTVIIDDNDNLDMGGAEIRDFAEQALEASPASPYDIDWSLASLQQITITENTTFTFSGLAAGKSITLEIIQGGAGSFTVVWPTMNWIGNSAPTLATAAGDVDLITMYVRADGTTVVGAHVGSYTP